MALDLKKTLSDDGRPLYRFPASYNYVIPGDIHFPLQDSAALKRLTVDKFPVDNGETNVLFLQGDFGDQEAFNKFAKDPELIVKSHSMKRERQVLSEWIDRWFSCGYDYIAVGPGNHGDRAGKLVYSNPGFIGMGWWWPYGSILNSGRIIILDSNYRAQIGKDIFLEHGDSLKGATDSSKKGAACSVAEANPDGRIHMFGHTHRAGIGYHTRYPAGKRVVTTAVNLGMCLDKKKVDYAKAPNWQTGCGYIIDSRVSLEVQ